jgi:NSS family neurotransmitter:Na+ symporter
MVSSDSSPAGRPTFASRFGLVVTMIGVAVGLGNVWRFPYMVGMFGGASFVLVYVLAVALVGVPCLMAEWVLGRHTRRGPAGAFERAGVPFGRPVGWLLFGGVAAGTAYYTVALGWVLWHGLGELARALPGRGLPVPAGAILPPESGFDPRAFGLGTAVTALVILACAAVLLRGLRRGIERASKVLVPGLFVALLVLVVRSVTLPGAGAGISWYVWKLDLGALGPGVILAALGQAVFSLSLGGTFMVIYGSYLGPGDDLRTGAAWTAGGDLAAGLLAGFAVLPAVFALGLEPAGGPGLLFSTLPQVFAALPAGWLFGALFFLGLFGAAFLSDLAAFEVLVAGLTDNTRLSRRAAVWTVAGAVLLLALPPMVSLEVFVPWDLTFGSGFQTLGALLAVLAVGWGIGRADALRELTAGAGTGKAQGFWIVLLHAWLRWVVPLAILLVGLWWLTGDVLGWL